MCHLFLVLGALTPLESLLANLFHPSGYKLIYHVLRG